ncbi:MAG: hypothetical protein HDQ87_11390 [Clostridia bacterium]|nr:hypothetical protein [Clostridia bacterium]
MQKTGTASLVLGLISLILALLLGTVAPFVPLVLGMIGLILGVSANRGTAKSGTATAGFVLSIVAVVISALFLLLWLFCLGTVSTAVDEAAGSFGLF